MTAAPTIDTEPRIIVALDYPTADEALVFADTVEPRQCRLKVGLELFTAAGASIVETLVNRGFDVFLDLKYHDIPNTVARACAAAARLGVWMLNVHTLGGRRMLVAAREAVEAATHRPLLVGVTILTSHSDSELRELGLARGIDEAVPRLADLVQEAGLDGVVCSPHEAASLWARFGSKFLLVTPGVRPAGSAPDDQQRVMTPQEAISQGAHYLVIGRPITRAADPLALLETINQSIKQG